MAINKFIGIGNLGKDPEMRFMPDGKAVSNFSIAITEKYRDKNGEAKEVTEWVSAVAFGKLAEICGEYLKKGQSAYIEGKLKTEKYMKDGIERYSTKVVLEKMQMVGARAESKADKPKGSTGSGFDDMEDDAIPF